ncbi:hypothetical protein [Castellaniella sp.]|uniref:hypothetical protein n=1 Tax=Castellaniella sp. TaxID=1955812 RepID=UPI002AFFFA11|nr:hypothetical protein [Castellaniella sp.]
MGFKLLGDGAGTVISDHRGTTVVNVVAGATATTATPDSNDTNIRVSSSSDLTLDIDTNTAYTGTITASSASNITANGLVDGATIVTKVAGGATLNTTGASALKLTTTRLVTLEATVAADDELDLTGSTLTALTSLTAHVGANGILTLDTELTEIHSISLLDTKGGGTVTLGNLGSVALNQDITVTANGLKGLTIGTIDTSADHSVTVLATKMSGDVTLGNITVADDAGGAHTGLINVQVSGIPGDIGLGKLTAKAVTVNAADAQGTVGGSIAVVIDADTATFLGSALGQNWLNITAAAKADVTTGSAADVINITGASIVGASAVFTVTTGLGSDSVSVLPGAGLTVVTITDFDVNTDAAVGIGTLSASINSAVNAAEYLTELKDITVNASEVILIANGFVEYDGDTYGIASGDLDCGDGDIVVQLTGVTGATAATDYFTN